MNTKIFSFFSITLFLILFSTQKLKAEEKLMRIRCDLIPEPTNLNNRNWSNFPGMENNRIYEIKYSFKENYKKVSEVKIFEEFNTGNQYLNQEWIRNNFAKTIEEIMYREKIPPQNFTQERYVLNINSFRPVAFNDKRFLLNDGIHMLNINSLSLRKTIFYNDDWVYKAKCKKIDLSEPPTYANNLAILSKKAYEFKENGEKDIFLNYFKKYFLLNKEAIEQFNKWEDDNNLIEVPYYENRFMTYLMHAEFQKNKKLITGEINPFYNIFNSENYINKAIDLLEVNNIKKNHSAYLTRAEINLELMLLDKTGSRKESLIGQINNDLDKYLLNSSDDLGRLYFIKGKSLKLLNSDSKRKEGCQNLKKSTELGYLTGDELKKLKCT